jgi:hypothetical protein
LNLKPVVGAACNVTKVLRAEDADVTAAAEAGGGGADDDGGGVGRLFCRAPHTIPSGMPRALHVFSHVVKTTSGELVGAGAGGGLPTSPIGGGSPTSSQLLTEWNVGMMEALAEPVAEVLRVLSYRPEVARDPMIQSVETTVHVAISLHIGHFSCKTAHRSFQPENCTSVVLL